MIPSRALARGAVNSKGPLVAFLNAVESMQHADESPVNLIFVAEGEEERGSISMPRFVREYARKLKRAEAVFFAASCQDQNGLAEPALGSEGILYIELETNGAYWGRGPTEFGVHGALKNNLTHNHDRSTTLDQAVQTRTPTRTSTATAP